MKHTCVCDADALIYVVCVCDVVMCACVKIVLVFFLIVSGQLKPDPYPKFDRA